MDPIKCAIEGSYQFIEEQQKALDEGRITEDEWFKIHKQHFTHHYLAADNPRAQSGHSGDEGTYRYSRGMILEALNRSGSFIDVGCANGHLMEMLHSWLRGTEIEVAFYGLDISEGLIDLAKRRLPNWQDHFFISNALYWAPPKKFDFVCTRELGYVPRKREKEFLEHLFVDYLKEGGRLILGPYTEKRKKPEQEEKLRAWGWAPSGYCEKSHQKYQVLCRRLLWFDK